jgi:tyrosyl-DNA phosphodiesterase-1
LLQYAAGMRVVVHTANLVYTDCNNKSQGLWAQDFPLKGPESPQTSAFQQGAPAARPPSFTPRARWPPAGTSRRR